MAKPRKILKWFSIGVGSLVAILIVLAIALPLVVDVDRFRPQIVDTANQSLRGKLEMGRLHLSLWGQIKVRVDGFTLSDSKGRKVIAAQDVAFHVPLWSLITASPRLTFEMRHPEVSVVKDKAGLNVLSLVKTQKSEAAPETENAPAEQSPAAQKKLPAIVSRARLGIEMTDARLAYLDKTSDFSSRVEALNVRVKDLSLSRPTEIEVDAHLDTRLGKTLLIKGPIVFTADAQPHFESGAFDKVQVNARVDLDKLEITYGQLFHKAPNVAMHSEATLSATPSSASLDKAVARFHNAEVRIRGGVRDWSSDDGPAIDLDITSNEVLLAPWSQLVPMLQAYELSGSASLKAGARGKLAKPQYHLEAGLKALRAKAPVLKAEPQIDASVRVVTDKVEKIEASFKAPHNDLHLQGSVVSFTHPKARFAITSTGMDLDELIHLPKSASKKTPSEASPKASDKAQPTDLDAALDPLRANAIARNTDAVVSARIPFLKIMNVRMEEMEGQMSLRQLVAKVDRFGMRVFGGTIHSDASIELRPKTPQYHFNAQVKGLDLKQAVTSQFALFRNTVFGKADFQMNGGGKSFNSPALMDNLTASGHFSVADARLASMDVAHMAVEAINKALADIETKFPQVKGHRVATPPNTQTGYDKVAATFHIAKGVFSMPDFSAVSGSHRGIDIQGATTVQLKGYGLNANWELIDTHNLTGAKNLSVEVQGVRVDPLLAEPGKPVRFPVRVGGTLFTPAPDYGSVPEALAKVALANAARAAQDKLKAEATKRVGTELKKVLGF